MGPCGWAVILLYNPQIACGPVRRAGKAHYFGVATARVIARLSDTQLGYVQWYVNAHSIPVFTLNLVFHHHMIKMYEFCTSHYTFGQSCWRTGIPSIELKYNQIE